MGDIEDDLRRGFPEFEPHRPEAQKNIIYQALEIAALGRPVFPCHAIKNTELDKAPKVDGGFHAASTDPETIRQWGGLWNDALIGIRPSTQNEPTFIVFDVDRQPDKAAAWLVDNFGKPAFVIPSSKPDRYHHYYLAADPIGNKVYSFGEIRGANGYVLVHHPELLIAGLRNGVLSGDKLDMSQIAQTLGKNKPNGRKGSSTGKQGYTIGTRHNQIMHDCFIAGLNNDKAAFEQSKENALNVPCNDADKYPLEKLERDSSDAWQGGKEARKNGLSNSDLADMWFSDCRQNFLCVDKDSKSTAWHKWTGTHWQLINDIWVFANIREYIKGLDLPRKVSKPLKSATYITGVEKCSRGLCGEHFKNFDTVPLQINTQAGVIDLQTGDLIEHNPIQRNMKITAVNADYDAGCPLWNRVLDEWVRGDKELKTFLQVIAGLCLRGDNIEQIFVMLHGGGQNGKSVFVDTLAKVMGDYAKPASPTVFKLQKFDQHPAELAALEGARLISVPELSINMTLDEALIKRFTGDELITARGMRQDPRSFRPVGIPILACNELPRVRDVGVSMQRRALLVPFDVKIKNRDVELSRKLETELPAIFNWMLEGHLLYQDAGLVKPKRVLSENKKYFQDMDTLARFFDECIFTSPGEKISVKQLYATYKKWAQDENIFTLSKVKFSRDFQKRFGIEKIRHKDIYFWAGINFNM